MGTQKKGTGARSVEFRKHLRPGGKRRQAKAERQADKVQINYDESELEESVADESTRILSQKKPKPRKRWKIEARNKFELTKEDWFTVGTYTTKKRMLNGLKVHQANWEVRVIRPDGTILGSDEMT